MFSKMLAERGASIDTTSPFEYFMSSLTSCYIISKALNLGFFVCGLFGALRTLRKSFFKL
jgi:hypothetical protein